jgi:hypothetical protein
VQWPSAHSKGLKPQLLDVLKQEKRVATSAAFFLDSKGPLRAMSDVMVKNAAGQPVADAEVTVQFYMAAMLTMNMPAIRMK